MAIDHFSWKIPLERTTEIRVLEFAEHVYIFEQRETTRPVDGVANEEPVVSFVQGIVDWNNLVSVKLGQLSEVQSYDPTRGAKTNADYVPVLVSDAGIEAIRTEGNPFGDHQLLKRLTDTGNLVRKGGKSFIDLFSEGFGPQNVFFISTSTNSLVDLNGKVLPEAHRFTYLNGLASDFYDIDQALSILLENPEVEVIKDQFGNVKQVLPEYGDPNAPTRYGISAIWRPTDKSWAEFLEKVRMETGEDKFVRALTNELLLKYDVLGLKEAGCRLEPEVAEFTV